ncbi:MAG TPA: formylmethanofuran dehydrogenase subunit C [Candidatus Polarisedimenticolia bacterium]|nr:formylmethanofuran dehydrogenase subunit C [Candidatus Polarisedimenticolia bacterium]
MSLRLTLRRWPHPPGVEAEAPDLLPERLGRLSRSAIEALRVRLGREEQRVGDLFEVDGTPGEDVTLAGDLSAFVRLGAGMTRGRLVVKGNAGLAAGSRMSGGRLEISGDAGARAGEGMTGGVLVVRGSTGDDLGGPPPGAARGVNRGAILVAGNAGARAGRRMRRGLIAIGGGAGPLAGTEMLAGTLVIAGHAGDGIGTWMRRGTILLGTGSPPPASAFADAGSGRFSFWALYDEALRFAGATIPEAWREGRFRRYVGDRSGGGLGEILVPEGGR